MKITADNKYELIDKYVGGLMDNQETEKFSSILKENEELSAEVNLVRELHDFQDFSQHEEDLKKTLGKIKKSGVSNSTKYLKYFGLLLIMSLALFYFFKTLNSSTSKELQEPMAMVEPLALTVKGDGDAEFKNVKEMQDLYNNKNYKAAFPYIENYLGHHPKDLDVLLAKGISLTGMNKYSEADKVFDQIKGFNPRVKKYKWYSAVNYIQQGKEQKGIELLKQIVSQESYRHKEAKTLLESLSN